MALRATSEDEKLNLDEKGLKATRLGDEERRQSEVFGENPLGKSGLADANEPPIGASKAREARRKKGVNKVPETD
jgi:hypothetical protein